MIRLPGNRRARIAFIHDVFMTALSFPLSLFLRVGDNMPALTSEYLWQGTAIFTAIGALIYLRRQLYRGVWRYASMNDLVALTKAVTLVILVFLPMLFVLTRLEAVPRSLPFINWFVLLALLGGPRFLYRLIKDRRTGIDMLSLSDQQIPILLVGSGDGTEAFLRELRRDKQAPYLPLAILDDRGGRVGQDIHGIPVSSKLEDLEALLDTLEVRPQRLVITKENLDGDLVRRVMDIADANGLTVSRAPRMTELRNGQEDDRLTVRPVAVEDLLGRPQQPLDRDAMEQMIQGRRVMVTGAGGTIGSELVRQILGYGPASITLFDASEYQLYLIDRELSESFNDIPREAILGDVRDIQRVNETMARVRPELVFHAAAYKHVPMVEANPVEGVLTNVQGTRTVADACRANGVACMVQISTDKAVNPTNIMGATKRLAEAYIQALDPISRAEGGTRYVVVRFGNVLGSTGSVVPLFKRQLEAGGPLTVTHPDVTRYFMTVREAVELVLQAAVVGVEDQEASGRIFILEMGQPVKVLDLARQMIRLAGLRPDEDIDITFTGLRPGEKLFEEILHGGEDEVPTRAPGMTLGAPRGGDLTEISAALDAMLADAQARREDRVLDQLRALVPEYKEPDPETMKVPPQAAKPV